MGTENAMLAATLAHGTTVIDNAALEPEVDDLIAMLCSMGARIERTAERRIEIEGVDRLRGAEHRVIGDRLEAATFAIAAAITRGTVTLTGVNPAHLGAFLEVCDRIGVAYETDAAGSALTVRAGNGQSLRAVDVRTDPYPGFSTDFQAPLAVLLSQADGTSTIHETIFEDRLDHMRELTRMGAEIELLDERHARITGPSRLQGAEVGIADLRAGATLILAALTATGTSVISGHRARGSGVRADRGKARRARGPDQPHRGLRDGTAGRLAPRTPVGEPSQLSLALESDRASRTGGTVGRLRP